VALSRRFFSSCLSSPAYRQSPMQAPFRMIRKRVAEEPADGFVLFFFFFFFLVAAFVCLHSSAYAPLRCCAQAVAPRTRAALKACATVYGRAPSMKIAAKCVDARCQSVHRSAYTMFPLRASFICLHGVVYAIPMSRHWLYASNRHAIRRWRLSLFLPRRASMFVATATAMASLWCMPVAI